ncbi:MAG: putative toxin-antitoxin system toxin component, PIN family [Spirochaetales bacterium]|nr:putative toxin-antitoxin system toxin component, PIN family [Spirochaetales bacterium]
MSLVLDTNIYISAFIFSGNSRKVVDMAIENKVDLFISNDILEEIKRVLQRKKFSLNNFQIHSIINEIEAITNIVFPDNELNDICRDRDDHIILECAEKSNAEFIITGDKDLLVLQKYHNTQIVSPADFLKILANFKTREY